MRLTVFSDYALRVLIYVAVEGEQRVTVTEIATAYGISKSHLTKVVQYLSALGYLETTRGKGGGIVLGREPTDITIGALLRATESESVMVECMGDGGECRITAGCTLPRMFKLALERFYTELDRFTLADLVTKPELLKSAFFREPPAMLK